MTVCIYGGQVRILIKLQRKSAYLLRVTEVKCVFTESYGDLTIDEFPWMGGRRIRLTVIKSFKLLSFKCL